MCSSLFKLPYVDGDDDLPLQPVEEENEEEDVHLYRQIHVRLNIPASEDGEERQPTDFANASAALSGMRAT